MAVLWGSAPHTDLLYSALDHPQDRDTRVRQYHLLNWMPWCWWWWGRPAGAAMLCKSGGSTGNEPLLWCPGHWINRTNILQDTTVGESPRGKFHLGKHVKDAFLMPYSLSFLGLGWGTAVPWPLEMLLEVGTLDIERIEVSLNQLCRNTGKTYKGVWPISGQKSSWPRRGPACALIKCRGKFLWICWSD
jgi:hypothetical protein